MGTLRSYLRQNVLRQYNIGPWLGALKDLSGRTMFYMTPINLFMLAATTYHVTAKAFISQFAPWINFWLFFGGLILLAIVAMIVEFKVVFPSSVFFSNIQNYKHGNLIRQDLESIMREVQKIDGRLETIEERLGENSEL